MSLSARRVWIEIIMPLLANPQVVCHSLRGECGLKFDESDKEETTDKSLSARRVWIEISLHYPP